MANFYFGFDPVSGYVVTPKSVRKELAERWAEEAHEDGYPEVVVMSEDDFEEVPPTISY